MNESGSGRERFITWLMLLGIWTLIGSFFGVQIYLDAAYSAQGGKPAMSWPQALILSLSQWYIWAILSIPVLHLARRFHFERKYWRRRVILHLLSGIFFALLKLFIEGLMRKLIPWAPPANTPPSTIVFHIAVLTYWAIIGTAHAIDYYRRFRERELRASQLEATLTQAQLLVLKMQLQPHFLFNTLHSISSLMHEDVEKAEEVLTLLSDMLRMSLENSGVQEVPLRKEIEFLQPYLEIQKIRFREQLRVAVTLAPETLDAQVPSLLLQPLVENAVVHGITKKASGGMIKIFAKHEKDYLHIQIRDDGPGHHGVVREGIGLTNTRARLRQLYGERCKLEICNGTKGGLVVDIHIPFHHQPNSQ